MSGATFAARGPRGRAGEQGPAGSDGAPGAAGPSGQLSLPGTATPGAAPSVRDTDQVWPGGDQQLGVATAYTIEIRATCERFDTKAARDMVTEVVVRTSLDGTLVIVDGQRVAPAVNSSGWSGTATITVTSYTTGGARKLRVQGTGPVAASSCNWLISGCQLRAQQGISA